MANIFLIGFMGTGKSAIASTLGSSYAMEVVELDEAIVEHEKMSINDIFKEKGEAYFRDVETKLLREYGSLSNMVISCGGGTPLREENVKVLRENGTVVLLSATPETIFERVRYSHNRPLLNDNMTVEHITELLNSRLEKYQSAADIIIETDGKSKDAIAEEIIHRIAKM